MDRLLLVSIIWGLSTLYFCDICTGASLSYKEQFAVEGSSYKMKCPDLMSNDSAPAPYIVWSVNGSPPRGQKYKLLSDGLVIRNVSKEDTLSNYTCTALDRQTFLPKRSEDVVLKLRQRGAKFLQTKGSSGSTEGNKVQIWGIVNQWKTLQCTMLSRPSPTFVWRNKDRDEEIHRIQDLYKIDEDDFTSNLTIFLHNNTLFGEYTCMASNTHGESIQNFKLTEGYKPKSPFLFPTFIGKDKIAVRVQSQEDKEIESGLSIRNFLVQYAPVGSLKSSEEDNARNGKFGGEYRRKWTTLAKPVLPYNSATHYSESFELKNLQQNTTYLLRSAVANAAAISDFSSSIRITTDLVPNTETDNGNENQTGLHEQSSENDRKEHGRAVDDVTTDKSEGSATINSSEKNGSKEEVCSQPKFRKTVITTITTTTLIESVDEADNDVQENKSPFTKKRVEEDTTINRTNLCTLT